MRSMYWVFAVVFAVTAAVGLYVVGIFQGWHGQSRDAGEIAGEALPREAVEERIAMQAAAIDAAGASDETQILFGDLHVHSTFSTDAFVWALPILRGEGANPVADACDFARYCSALDFWSMTDHAEALTPARWDQTLASLQACEARSDPEGPPDVIPFIGFEWTQVAGLPEDHFGHKNVVFETLDPELIAARPIAASGATVRVLRDDAQGLLPPEIAFVDLPNRQDYYDFGRFVSEVRGVPVCDRDASSGDLPPDCYEMAATPGELVDRLEAQGLGPLIIPHGSSWGFYTPPGVSWDKSLIAEQRPEAMSLVEVFSGHGNSEEYRSWRYIGGAVDDPICPEATEDYLPTCQRAGQIIEERCLAAGESAGECAARAAEARANAAWVGLAAHLTVEGEEIEDWLDAGQCQDCFLPSFNHRPTSSVQAGLAVRNFDGEEPEGFHWGFIGSSDTHTARPGIGYKPVERHYMTDTSGAETQRIANLFIEQDEEPTPRSVRLDRDELLTNPGFQITEVERQASFFTGGGLVAAHATERSRSGVWDALQRREVYATSGLRQLLWFDLIDEAGEKTAAMGAEAEMSGTPRFRVRAVGALMQEEGCPDYAVRGLPADRLQRLCRGECYNPGDQRYPITRVEVIRIRPQITPGEALEGLIEDVWLSLDCEDYGQGCEVEFDDPSFSEGGRDAIYYVRAIQAPSGQVNGANLRCTYDETGACIAVEPCFGDYRTEMDEDCVADVEHRAWSSPIYLTHRPQETAAVIEE
jgi:hypothetical protein